MEVNDQQGTPGRDTPNGSHQSGGVRAELMEQKLFDVAARLFAERGFASTSLQDLADAMGISRPALYYYVKSKEDILARLVAEFPMRDAERLRQLRTREDLAAPQKLREMVHQHVMHIAANPGQLRLLDRNEHHLTGEVAEAHTRAKRAVLKEFTAVIDTGFKEGHFDVTEARTGALVIIGMCNWVAWWFEPGGTRRDSDIAEQIAEMAIRSVVVPGRRSPTNAREIVTQLRADLGRLDRMLPDKP